MQSKNHSPKIFLSGPSFPFRGGISHYTTLLFNHLSQQHSVIFYTFRKQYPKLLFPGKNDRDHSRMQIIPLKKTDNGPGAESEIMQELHPFDPVSWLKAAVKARECSLVLLPWWTVFWAPHYLLFRLIAKTSVNKIFFLCHNVIEHEGSPVKKIIARLVLRNGDGFLLHTREEKQRLFNLLGKPCSSVIFPHPVYEIFNRNRYTQAEARHVLGISPLRKVILFFGFVRRYKGIEYLLKALTIVKQSDPRILLLVVGEVWGGDAYAIDLLTRIREMGLRENVRFINQYVPNEDVELYFRASDFSVLPYIQGSGSGALQVCYGMDTPVVATDIGSFREIIRQGVTGLTVPPRNENQLAEAIIRM